MSETTMTRELLAREEPVEFRKRSRSGSGVGELAGYAAVYYRAGDSGTEFALMPGIVERILPGAFDDALAGDDDILALRDHDVRHVLGRRSSGTLKVSSDKRGLRYRVDLPDTTDGRDLRELLLRGDITGSSLGMQVTHDEWHLEGEVEVRSVRRAMIFDVSPVADPAYASTTAEARSRWQASRQEWKRRAPGGAARLARAVAVRLALDERFGKV